MCLDTRLLIRTAESLAVPTAENGGPNCGRPYGRWGESRPACRVAPLSGASPSAHLVGTGKGNCWWQGFCMQCVARISPLWRSCAALLCAAAVPALADPGASASGGASASSEIVVKRGDRGDAVRSIQRQLGLTADGVFGPMTERAVKRFQRRHDLVPGRHRRPAHARSARAQAVQRPLAPPHHQPERPHPGRPAAHRRVRVRRQPARDLAGRHATAASTSSAAPPGTTSAAPATPRTPPSGSRTGSR